MSQESGALHSTNADSKCNEEASVIGSSLRSNVGREAQHPGDSRSVRHILLSVGRTRSPSHFLVAALPDLGRGLEEFFQVWRQLCVFGLSLHFLTQLAGVRGRFSASRQEETILDLYLSALGEA